MTYALPEYLTRNAQFDDCPPGHRFGLYFNGWEDGWRKPTNKSPAFRTVANTLPSHSRAALQAICQRQAALASHLGSAIFTYPAQLTAPLATGLGNEHPLENGFAFLNPHGLPYLAGSGVKGVIRRAAEELEKGEWGDQAGWSKEVITLLFGPGEDDPERDTNPRRGALMFWDLFFRPANDKTPLLAVEIMTPHHREYLQGHGAPHPNEQPNPIPFLAVAAKSECSVYVQCNTALIPTDHAALRESWQNLLSAAIEHAGDWLGFGAKSAVGYGRLEMDPKAQQEREQAREQAAQEQKRQQAEAALAAMPADEQLLKRLKSFLEKLPIDPRTEKPIVQATSGKDWQPALTMLGEHIATLDAVPKAKREQLASTVKKLLSTYFKIEGKAERAMKEHLATIRGG